MIRLGRNVPEKALQRFVVHGCPRAIPWPRPTVAWSVNNFLMTGPKAYLIYSSSVAAGAQSGIEECKYQFAWDRWNCPERALQLSSHGGLRSANRETAFVHAISSAGVMYTLTRNCSLGDFDNCGCDDSRNGQLGGQGWLWGGCSDNVGFGEAISKQFVDALETGQDARAAMNLHNNEAGRKGRKKCRGHKAKALGADQDKEKGLHVSKQDEAPGLTPLCLLVLLTVGDAPLLTTGRAPRGPAWNFLHPHIGRLHGARPQHAVRAVETDPEVSMLLAPATYELDFRTHSSCLLYSLRTSQEYKMQSAYAGTVRELVYPKGVLEQLKV
ncbi:Protein Wnt-8b [Fukomys damarensis]|uniref:Protein Wnt n=1 Tax=Fukomys damarensis TaxID=885580 RepID=A0A091DPB3_FUKDA|nr:Protein Wnt-8b [Fukomys damarensis]